MLSYCKTFWNGWLKHKRPGPGGGGRGVSLVVRLELWVQSHVPTTDTIPRIPKEVGQNGTQGPALLTS